MSTRIFFCSKHAGLAAGCSVDCTERASAQGLVEVSSGSEFDFSQQQKPLTINERVERRNDLYVAAQKCLEVVFVLKTEEVRAEMLTLAMKLLSELKELS